tara:strand:- start:2101 stop:2460 length:360 start_codon:yes stop_codon:yes gene_type:complete
MEKELKKKLISIASSDITSLEESQKSYGDSWKKRGGVGAYMMLSRKWDRLENQCKKHGYDIFLTAKEDNREEGIIDDIRDLRRYLTLVESELLLNEGKTNEEDPESNLFREERDEWKTR